MSVPTTLIALRLFGFPKKVVKITDENKKRANKPKTLHFTESTTLTMAE